MKPKPCDLYDAPCWCDLAGTSNPERDEEICRHEWTFREIKKDRALNQQSTREG